MAREAMKIEYASQKSSQGDFAPRQTRHGESLRHTLPPSSSANKQATYGATLSPNVSFPGSTSKGTYRVENLNCYYHTISTGLTART